MKKTIIRSIALAALAIVAGYNVYQSNVKTNDLSDLALANVEALANLEGFVFVGDASTVTKGVKNVIYTDMGRDDDCIMGRTQYVYKIYVSCLGEGNLPCREGNYEKVEKTNIPCGVC